MRFAQRRAEPARFTLRALLGFDHRLRQLGLRSGFSPLALHHKRNSAHHGLILAIGDVISHGLLHRVPSFLVPETIVILDRPGLSGANGTEFQIRAIEISGLACSGRPGKQVQAL
jgi:hypothetical protein